MKQHILMTLMALCLSWLSAAAQGNLTVSGLVMTEKGEPITGATISVKEVPGKGVITELDGHFKLTDVVPGQTLSITYIGFKPYKQKIEKSDERMRIVLKEDLGDLNEVVVVG